MRFALCDDDLIFCNQLKKYLEEYFTANKLKRPEISIFECGESLLASDEKFDIAFLDVEMSGVSGIHVGNELKKRNKRIIFMIITSYNDYLETRHSVFRRFAIFPNHWIKTDSSAI